MCRGFVFIENPKWVSFTNKQNDSVNEINGEGQLSDDGLGEEKTIVNVGEVRQHWLG